MNPPKKNYFLNRPKTTRTRIDNTVDTNRQAQFGSNLNKTTQVKGATTSSDTCSDISIDSTDAVSQRIVELEEMVHTLVEEKKIQDQRIKELEINPPTQILKEFDYFCTMMPMRGTQFVTGEIDVRLLKIQKEVNISYSAPFNEDPVLFVFMYRVNGGSCTINPKEKSRSGFIVNFERMNVDCAAVFWMAYLPIKEKSRFAEISKLIKETDSANTKSIEGQVKNYVRRYGVLEEDKDGNTMLHHLVAFNHTSLVEHVLQNGANINALNKYKYSPLHTAMSMKEINIDIINLLMNYNPDLRIKNENMRTPLHYLCRNSKLEKNIALLYKIILNDSDVEGYINEISKIGETALTMVCQHSMCEEAIKLLCEKGAHVNQTTDDGSFPLYYAISKKKYNVVQILLQYGADIDKEYKGKSVVKIAEETGELDVLVSLIEERYAIKVFSDNDILRMEETFDSLKPIYESWTNNVTSTKKILVSTEGLENYHIENFYTSCTHRYEILLNKNYHDPTLPIPYFKKYIASEPHQHYLVVNVDPKTEVRDVLIITISSDQNDMGGRKYIVWSKRSAVRKRAPQGTTDLQILRDYGLKTQRQIVLPQQTVDKQLLQFENEFVQSQHKFGVIYAAVGQTRESQMFENNTGSPYFERFLELIGEKIQLSGYCGYSGQLDVKYGSSGTHTYVNTTFNKNIQIAFHVSTYLPSTMSDDQQLERKKHISNDVVTLIFKEYQSTPELIDIVSFKSQYTYVYVVVGYDVNQTDHNYPKYSVNVVCRPDVPPIPPFITTDEHIHSKLFSDFLIAKMINAEIASKESSQFRTRNLMMRQRKLESISEIVSQKN